MASQNAASMSAIIQVNGKVVQSTASGFKPQLLILTQNPICPTNTALSFNNTAAVTAYFGNTTNPSDTNALYVDSVNAGFYFNGSNKTQVPASSVLFYRYCEANTGAFTRGAALSAVGTVNDLTNLKLVTAGTLNLTFNGTAYVASAINLSSNNSFNAMAATLQTAIQAVTGLTTVTVGFDSTTNGFTITFPYNGSLANTVDYITNSGAGASDQLAQRMKITSVTGSVLSQGVAAQTPAQVMTSVTNLTQNFATFICNFDINSDPTYAIVLGLTSWNNVQTTLYLPLFYDLLGGAGSPITNPMQQALIAAGWGQSSVTPYTFNTPLMYIINNNATIGLPFGVAGTLGSYNFNAANGIIQLNSTSYSGITPIVNNDPDLNTLMNVFGANSYVNLNTRANNFQWFETGVIGGSYGWADTLIGYMWLADQIQTTLASTMATLNSIPYSQLSIINSVVEPIFNTGLTNGVVQKNIPISATVQQALIQQAGYDFTSILYNKGYYMPQVQATPSDIANRTLSNVNAWYTYAGGPVTITVNLTTVI